jgi:small basic protein
MNQEIIVTKLNKNVSNVVTWPIIGLCLGGLIGYFIPFEFSQSFSKYSAIAILAGLDTSFGGIRAGLEDRFDLGSFISGFTFNSILAASLTYLGDTLGIDLNVAASVVFGVRLFDNLAIIRRHLLGRFWS